MKELSSYELCLLIYLCYKKGGKVYAGSLPSRQEEHYNVWSKLQNCVNSHCKKTVITVNDPSIEIKNDIRKITHLVIKVEDKPSLEKFLDTYCAYFEDDALDSYNFNKTGFNGIGKQFNNLIGQFKKSIDTNKVLKDCFIDDTKYLPIILWGLRKKCIGFKDIRFSLAPNEEQLDKTPKIELRKRKLRNNDSDPNIIDFCITLDLSKFKVARNVGTVETVGQRKKPTKLGYPEWKIFICIHNAVKNEPKTGICTADKHIFTIRGININSTFKKDLSHLNTNVRDLLDIQHEKTRFLVKPNEQDETKYDIDMVLYQDFWNLIEDEKKPAVTNGYYNAYEKFRKAELANYQRFTNSN